MDAESWILVSSKGLVLDLPRIDPVEEAQSSMGHADRVGNKVKTQVAIPARKSNTERNPYGSASITLENWLLFQWVFQQ